MRESRGPRHRVSQIIGVAFSTAVSSAWAQPVPPDAGRLLEELRPRPPAPRQAPPLPDGEAQPPAAQDGVRIPVLRLRITGATRFSAQALHGLVAEAEGKDLSMADLQDLARRITSYYRRHGFLLARAYLPAQEVQGGEVEIAVLEGRLGWVAVNNRAGLGGAALAPLSLLRPGEVAEAGALETSLLLLSDLPGVDVASTLRPSALPGATDLLLDLAPGKPVTGSVEADNHGDRYSGRYRLGGVVNLNAPLHLGDQLSLRALASDEGLTYERVAYQLPVNASGSRVGIAASDLRYTLGGGLAPLRASGKAATGSLFAIHPFVRSRRLNLNGQLQYEQRTLEDMVESVDSSTGKSSRRWSGGFSGDWRDEIGGGASNVFALSYTAGHVQLDPVSRGLDAATARSAGDFGKWNGFWSRTQSLGANLSLHATFSGQWASKNLDSSEKMALGGANGVRAYPQGEAPGDQGALLSLELRFGPGVSGTGHWQGAVFFDDGYVRVNKRPWSAGDNRRSLSGVGVGLSLGPERGWTVKASLAWRLGSERPLTDSRRMPQAWVQVGKAF